MIDCNDIKKYLQKHIEPHHKSVWSILKVWQIIENVPDFFNCVNNRVFQPRVAPPALSEWKFDINCSPLHNNTPYRWYGDWFIGFIANGCQTGDVYTITFHNIIDTFTHTNEILHFHPNPLFMTPYSSTTPQIAYPLHWTNVTAIYVNLHVDFLHRLNDDIYYYPNQHHNMIADDGHWKTFIGPCRYMSLRDMAIDIKSNSPGRKIAYFIRNKKDRIRYHYLIHKYNLFKQLPLAIEKYIATFL